MNVRAIVFNLGRTDYRERYLIAYVKRAQGSLVVQLERHADALEVAQGMFLGTGILAGVRGHTRFLQSLFPYVRSWAGKKIGRGGLLRLYSCLISHTAWRVFPGLVRHLCGAQRPPRPLIRHPQEGPTIQTESHQGPNSNQITT